MSVKNINFADKKNQKIHFLYEKTLNTIENNDLNNILVSKKEAYGNKRFI